MIDWLLQIDEALFLWLNGLHSDWLDPIMVGISMKWIWLPLYLLLAVMLYKNYGWQGLWYLVAILVAIGITDQLTSGFMKPYFGRLRPCHDPSLSTLVHIVDGCGGKFGFVSGHSANSFCIATFFVTLFKEKAVYKWLILWAVIVAYSRVYLGVHYPGDIIVGGLIGSIIGIVTGSVAIRLSPVKN